MRSGAARTIEAIGQVTGSAGKKSINERLQFLPQTIVVPHSGGCHKSINRLPRKLGAIPCGVGAEGSNTNEGVPGIKHSASVHFCLDTVYVLFEARVLIRNFQSDPITREANYLFVEHLT